MWPTKLGNSIDGTSWLNYIQKEISGLIKNRPFTSDIIKMLTTVRQ